MSKVLPLVLAGLMAATSAQATDFSKMSENEREAFRAEVRAYLLDHPEVLMEAIQVLQSREQAAQTQADRTLVSDNAKAIFEDGYSWVGGNPEGDVTLVEFLDYKCGYCKKAFPEVAELLKRDGKIRFIVKEFPILGPQSELAARFAISVKRVSGDEAYAKVHDSLMEFRGEISQESLTALSDRLSLDTAAVMDGMGDPETDRIIAANHQLAQALQINGTPGFVFGDGLVRGYVSLDDMTRIVGELRG